VTTSSLLPIFGRATEATRETFQDRLNEAAAWVDWVQSGAPGANDCIICGSSGPLERHHIAGKNNSETVVPACRLCHERLSERQNGWDPRWIRADNPPELRESLFLRGLSDLCEEKGRFGSAYHELGKRLRAVYAKVSRGSAS
jgi:hypothetical protein